MATLAELVKLVEFIRTRCIYEYVDANGHIWLMWNDRAVRLAAYYR